MSLIYLFSNSKYFSKFSISRLIFNIFNSLLHNDIKEETFSKKDFSLLDSKLKSESLILENSL